MSEATGRGPICGATGGLATDRVGAGVMRCSPLTVSIGATAMKRPLPVQMRSGMPTSQPSHIWTRLRLYRTLTFLPSTGPRLAAFALVPRRWRKGKGSARLAVAFDAEPHHRDRRAESCGLGQRRAASLLLRLKVRADTVPHSRGKRLSERLRQVVIGGEFVPIIPF